MFINPHPIGSTQSRESINEELRNMLKNKEVKKSVSSTAGYTNNSVSIYDADGYLKKERFPSFELTYRYFENGLLESISKSKCDSDTITASCTYKYTSDGKIQSIYDNIGPNRGKFVTNIYRAEDGLVEKKIIKDAKKLKLIDILLFEYDEHGRITRVFGKRENTTKEYDDEALVVMATKVNYNKKGEAISTPQKTIITYNPAGSITRQESPEYIRENFYDETGLLIQKEIVSKFSNNNWIKTTSVYEY